MFVRGDYPSQAQQHFKNQSSESACDFFKTQKCVPEQEFFGKEDGMHLLTWILVGAAIGWGTGKAIHGNGYGPFRDVVLGMGGGVVGGFLMNTQSVGGYSGTILTTMVAMIGAVLLTMLVGFSERRRVYARAI